MQTYSITYQIGDRLDVKILPLDANKIARHAIEHTVSADSARKAVAAEELARILGIAVKVVSVTPPWVLK